MLRYGKQLSCFCQAWSSPRVLGLSVGGACLRDHSTQAHEAEPAVLCTTSSGVSTITLNRPRRLNALNNELMGSLLAKLRELDGSADTRVIIITGGGRAFAAGADIKEISHIKSYNTAVQERFLESWDEITGIRKPIIAAVNGAALGGGCELVMACDMAIAAEDAVLGLPEVTLGLIPGGGGTQRLVRAVGKARAMAWILSARKVSAREAEQAGLVSSVVPPEQLLQEASELAAKIAAFPTPVVAKAKECVNAAFESPLREGLRLEKREFWSCFALHDSQEGVAAFLEKRPAKFSDS